MIQRPLKIVFLLQKIYKDKRIYLTPKIEVENVVYNDELYNFDYL